MGAQGGKIDAASHFALQAGNNITTLGVLYLYQIFHRQPVMMQRVAGDDVGFVSRIVVHLPSDLLARTACGHLVYTIDGCELSRQGQCCGVVLFIFANEILQCPNEAAFTDSVGACHQVDARRNLFEFKAGFYTGKLLYF